MSAQVYHLDFKRGEMVPMLASELLPVGSVVTYEDRANPRRRAVVIGSSCGEFGHGQQCVWEDGQASSVHASDPDRYGRTAAAWHFERSADGAPVILNAEEIAAFLTKAEAQKQADEAAAEVARVEKARADAEERTTLLSSFSYLERATGSKKSSHALASSNLKKLLAREFPGVVFSVSSDSFSMGNSVDCRWEDGPTHDEVDKFADRFQNCDFDGSDDSTHYRHTIWPELFGGAKYVNCHRETSHARIIEVAAEFGHTITFSERGAMQGAPDWETERMIYRETGARSFYVKPAAFAAMVATLEGISSPGALMRLNAEKNGVEIVFSTKPAAKVLERIKGAGFRWSRFSSCWYAKQSPENIAFAQSLAGGVA
jgi:hypothetical protein